MRTELQAVGEVKTAVHAVKADLRAMNAKFDRMVVLFEDQDARNKIVLDGHTTVISRHDQVEQRLTDVEDNVRYLATTRPAG